MNQMKRPVLILAACLCMAVTLAPFALAAEQGTGIGKMNQVQAQPSGGQTGGPGGQAGSGQSTQDGDRMSRGPGGMQGNMTMTKPPEGAGGNTTMHQPPGEMYGNMTTGQQPGGMDGNRTMTGPGGMGFAMTAPGSFGNMTPGERPDSMGFNMTMGEPPGGWDGNMTMGQPPGEMYGNMTTGHGPGGFSANMTPPSGAPADGQSPGGGVLESNVADKGGQQSKDDLIASLISQLQALLSEKK